MAFDGIVINSLANELKNALVGAKIEKIYQPEKDEICFKIRTREENRKLVISASASNPRIYLAQEYNKINPKKAPLFCMTLRKHIQSGVIINIEQVGFERIIKISVGSYDELKEKTVKDIYVEIMGKYSNIIVVLKKENKILDSIKRVPQSISRARQILPGIEYELPPPQDKINPLEKIDFDRFRIKVGAYEKELYKAIYSNLLGFSPLIAKEVCFRANIDYKISAKEVETEVMKKLYNKIVGIFEDLSGFKYYPNLVIDRKRDKLIEFSCINLTQYSEYDKINLDTISEVIENYYFLKDRKERINQRTSSMKKTISSKLERLNKKIKKQNIELKESMLADEYKIKGELITAYIYMINKGMSNIKLQNFYDDNKEITIDLDFNLSPSENAQRYFKKYNKFKTANYELTKMLVENKDEARYLENILLSIENVGNFKELMEIREELIRGGYIKSYKMPKKNNKLESKYNRYISSAGNMIIVGKNNKQNDYLTLRLADNEDLWFHTKDIPGSHVVLKCAEKKVEESELLEAALLAAYFSKGKMSSNVAVDYTQKKNVKKPSGAKPGMVIYEKNKTIYVTPTDEEKVKIRQVED